MPRTQESRFLAVSGPLEDDVLLLKSIHMTERMSSPFELQLELMSENGAINPTDLLGENMTVRMESARQGARYFNGFVKQWQQGIPSAGLARYRATLVPWVWFLSRAANCRIFQEMSIPDIIKQVFRDQGFSDFVERLNGTYEALEYCVQYRETDLNFVSRLMEQVGMYYFFSHENGKHTLVLADQISSHAVFPNYDSIAYHLPERQIAGMEYITDFSVETRVKTTSFAHTDFDFIKPRANLEAKSQISRSHAANSFEVYDYPGFYVETAAGETLAKVRMEELQSHYEVGVGQTDSRGIAVGSKFALADYPRDDLNKEWLIIASSLMARSDEMQGGAGAEDTQVACSFTVIPALSQFRPARQTPTPVISGPQTAIVVGKSGEEIWTDKYGRVKVSFHWDRESPGDETSSCWVRVAQVWAGKKWGSMHIPRVGQEVIVEFLEGDPDRPIITGRVYNGQEMPPYTLPGNATMSGLKSNSSKGGGGFNEFRFEDKKGEEQIFTHAEKDMHTRVKNDALQIVLNNTHSIIKKDSYSKVEQDVHSMVKRDQIEDIGRHHNLTVGGDQATRVGKTLSLTVLEDVAEVFKKNHSEITTEKIFYQGEEVVIEGKKNVTIHVGGSYIAINADGIKIATDGEIVLDAKKDITITTTSNLNMEATQNASLKGTAGLTVESPASTMVKGIEATVEGSGMLNLKGGLVKIN